MILEAVKDYLAPKRFGTVAYLCVIVHLLCGLIFSAVTAALRASENGKFSCSVDAKSTATYKKQVDQSCYLRYDQTYNSPVPLYGFVLLSTGFTVLISVIYSLIVSTRVDEIESSDERQADSVSPERDRRTVYVFYSYFFHLVLRMLFGVIFTILQHTFLYPNGFHLKFSCSLPSKDQVITNKNTKTNASINVNNTSADCENATAIEKRSWGICVSLINIAVAFVILVEVIYLCRRLPILNSPGPFSWSSDDEFVTEHLLRKRYINVPDPLEVTQFCSSQRYSITDNSITVSSNQDGSTGNYGIPESNVRKQSNENNSISESRNMGSNTQDCVTSDSTYHNSLQFYKQQVLNRPRAPDINYVQRTNLDNLYIDVVIHTERAKHEFSKNMKRDEIYDVYMKVPPTSIHIERIRGLFCPNEDTKGKVPRSILAIGRPGIGKTVLTEKIIRDWADGIDECYRDKVTFIFKIRWFNGNIKELTDISLKKFLQLGTRLNDDRFEILYEEITKEPEKAILIFDGLDEFYGNAINCLDQSTIIPDDPNTCMSAMNLFVKLVLGAMLKGATILVTSRPTADKFYSKLDFGRSVEIVGFTSDRIEEYVSQFCLNSNRSDLKLEIWDHIKSSSELLNLCYIPVNCFIVCVTLSGCLSDLRHDSSTLPTRLTELYLGSVDYFEKQYHRRAYPMTEEAIKKLQQLAFLGVENGKLVFDQEMLDEQMKTSGLLNSLSNPIFPLQAQFCFIHLTIQEFLAAKHVIETLAPAEIKEFISSHVGCGEWHLVLQFVAGLLGKKIKMFDSQYKDCVFAFVESFKVTGEIEINYNAAFLMKCLREVDDETIAENICETTALNNVEKLYSDRNCVSPSEWAAVTFVCKHMKNLAVVELKKTSTDCLQEVLELLRTRCVNHLTLNGFDRSEKLEVEHVFGALTKSNCTLNHQHSELTSLTLEFFGMTDAGLSKMCVFFKNGHASHLEGLNLSRNEISPCGTSKLCEVLNNENCPELTYLCLSGNLIGDEGAIILCDSLIEGLCNIYQLSLSECSLTDRCIPSLCMALQDERCQLTYLSLWGNFIGDKGVSTFFEDALTKEHSKLTELTLDTCSLTDQCIPSLCEALQHDHCKLTALSLGNNAIGDKGVGMLFENALIKKHCKLTKLNIDRCSLTGQCMSSLCKALQDESCQLTDLSLWTNTIGDEGLCMLFENALTKEHCKIGVLGLRRCSLTDQCIPSLCKALQDEHCKLTVLLLGHNAIGDKGVVVLFENALTEKHCKLIQLDLDKCKLTDQCADSLRTILQDERCKLRKLSLRSNNFTESSKCLLQDESGGERSLRIDM